MSLLLLTTFTSALFDAMANILLVEPFYAGSHKQWADGLKQHSNHEVELLTLPGRHWKWRMHGAAVTLEKKYKESYFKPDLILTTDFLDVATFKGLSGCSVPIIVYFHENQLTYPWSPEDEDVKYQRDMHYSFINYTSALAADKVIFNSNYHKDSFLAALPDFLKAFPDHQNLDSVRSIRDKSEVVYVGLALDKLQVKPSQKANSTKVVLWNHRWEFDKDPEQFFDVLSELKEEQVPFKLIVCGENYDKSPDVFSSVEKRFKSNLLHFGYVESAEEYHDLLQKADIALITSRQDFFGISIAEAAYAGSTLLLPQRLTYPEIYKDAAYFYENKKEAKAKLRSFLLDELKSVDARKTVSQFDWQKQIINYDKLFENSIYGTKN